MAGKGNNFGFYTFWWELVFCFCIDEMSEGMNFFLANGLIHREMRKCSERFSSPAMYITGNRRRMH